MLEWASRGSLPRAGDDDVDGAGAWPRCVHGDAYVELTAVAHSVHEAGLLLDIADCDAPLREAAEQALLGGEEEIQKFLQDAQSIQNIDNRIETARLAMTSGPYVREAAVAALQTTPTELEDFLAFGYQEPQDQDNRIETARLTQLGGTYVREAGETALQGSAEERELFLSQGQYTALKTDNRIEAAYLASNGTPNVKTAAAVALRGTPEDIAEFLDIGQFTARARDLEQTKIEELIKQAKSSGKQAADATKTVSHVVISPPAGDRG
ncbi:ALF repeat-containing protein [Streptomyces sp. st140]|uniref:ALF repeat-containing protein n=1 Tax=Streptomyces sp. st140 TaxID=1828052 RepID=UPI000BEFED62|nr:ALF repeat-containing protein [Streptomyces sp. st140]